MFWPAICFDFKKIFSVYFSPSGDIGRSYYGTFACLIRSHATVLSSSDVKPNSPIHPEAQEARSYRRDAAAAAAAGSGGGAAGGCSGAGCGGRGGASGAEEGEGILLEV